MIRKSLRLLVLIKMSELREDMAKRIMYSLLPSIDNEGSGKNEYALQLQHAVDEPVKKIIKYSLQAIKHELKHFYEDVIFSSTLQQKINNINPDIFLQDTYALYDTNYYEDFLIKAIQIFKHKEGWSTNFGGEPWQKIAEITLKLYKLSVQLDEAKKSKNIEEAHKIRKDLFILTNVFDQLAHNTSSIFRNLVQIEQNFQNKKPWDMSKEDAEESQKIKKYVKDLLQMRDASELKDFQDTYHIIEPHLLNSDERLLYKDYIAKMRSKNKQVSTNLKAKLKKIELKKILHNDIIKVENSIKQLNNLLDLVSVSKSTTSKIVDTLSLSLSGLQDAIFYFERNDLDPGIIQKIYTVLQDFYDAKTELSLKLLRDDNNLSINPNRYHIQINKIVSCFNNFKLELEKFFND